MKEIQSTYIESNSLSNDNKASITSSKYSGVDNGGIITLWSFGLTTDTAIAVHYIDK